MLKTTARDVVICLNICTCKQEYVLPSLLMCALGTKSMVRTYHSYKVLIELPIKIHILANLFYILLIFS
jgi:hypothetical protein